MSAWTSSLRAGRSLFFFKKETGLKTEDSRLASKKYSGDTAGSSFNFFQQLGAGCNHGFVFRTLKKSVFVSSDKPPLCF